MVLGDDVMKDTKMRNSKWEIGDFVNNLNFKRFLRAIIPFIICTSIYIIVFRIWKGNISIPFSYRYSDDFVHAMWIKAALNNSSFWKHPLLGFPYEQTMYSFNHIPFGAVLLAKFLRIFTQNYAVVLNIYYYLTYVGTMYAFIYVCKKINIKYELSVFGGIIFAFCQYHFVSNISHLTASSYMAVPFIFLMCYYIYFNTFEINIKFKLEIFISCFLISCFDTFYAFFGCFLLLITTVISYIKKQRKGYLLGIICIGLISFSTICIQLPSILYKINTSELVPVSRKSGEAFYWGLKMITLIIPAAPKHLFSILRKMYLNGGLPGGENLINYLGILGIIGFLGLVYYFLKNNTLKNEKEHVGYFVSLLTIFVLFLGVSGGIGLAFAVLVSPIIRTYCRTFVYIYFFAIIGLLLLLSNKYYDKFKLVYKGTFLVLLVVFHLVDIQANCYIPNYSANEERFEDDAKFISDIEHSINSEAAILCLPYVDFPENNTLAGGNYNGGLRGYFHSNSLKWGYGLVYGTPENADFKAKYASDNVAFIIENALNDGYDAIYIDTTLLENAEQYLTAIAKILNILPITNKANTLYCYPLNRAIIKQAPFVEFGAGFYQKESAENGTYWNWSQKSSSLLVGGGDKVKFSFDIASLDSKTAELKIRGANINETLTISNSAQHIELNIDLNGIEKIEFISEAITPKLETDSRALNFALYNYTIENIGGSTNEK